MPTLVPQAATGCSLHLALQLLHIGTDQPDKVTDTTSLPVSEPLAAHVEELVLDSIDAGETMSVDGRWRQRLYKLWQLPSTELQEMLALRGLNYELYEQPNSAEMATPSTDVTSEDTAALTGNIGSGHAILVYRMLEYEQELADPDEDDEVFDDSMFRLSDQETGGTWQLSSGGGADADTLAEFEALVGVVRGQLPVPVQLSDTVELLQVRARVPRFALCGALGSCLTYTLDTLGVCLWVATSGRAAERHPHHRSGCNGRRC